MTEATVPREFYPGITRYNGDKSFKKSLLAGVIVQDDVDLIREFVHERQAQRHISDGRVNKTIFTLVNWRRFILRPYREAGIADIYSGVAGLKTGKSTKDRSFKQNTVHDYIRILKPFILWLIENGYSVLPEKKILGITAPAADHQTTKPDEILTLEEIEQLIKVCMNPRDRAFIALFYESGARIGEVCRLTWRDVIFDKYGVKVYIDDQKTNKRRYSRLTMSRQDLAAWKADYHPGEALPDSLVFLTFKGRALDYIQACRIIQRLVERTGMKKRVHPHLFRKSRITHMIAQNYQESVIKESLWGNINTGMFRTYVCLAEKDIDAEFLERAGIQVKQEENKILQPRPCPECHAINSPNTRFCPECGTSLTGEAAEEQRDLEQRVLTDREVLREIIREEIREEVAKTRG